MPHRRYFQDIVTLEQAYLLGLLAADGSVSSTSGRYNFAWPQKLLDEMAIPFLLGYFDGDGCLSAHANGRLQWTLLGCEAFLWKAREHITRWSGVGVSFPAQSDKRIKHVYRIDAMADKAMAIDRALNASELGLPRKHLPGLLEERAADIAARW
jgi:hypothetical protein